MIQNPVYFLIHGLIEKADSIGQDLANQYRALSRAAVKCRVFAGLCQSGLYPDLPVESIESFEPALAGANPTIIYHWCDGWDQIDRLLIKSQLPIVLRWHNNTPPWFFPRYSKDLTARTLRGFVSILETAKAPNLSFMTNSAYSARQLTVLGVPAERISVVYPISDYLLGQSPIRIPAKQSRLPTVRLLFVGRIVPNKGHLHLVKAARALSDIYGIPCTLTLPGRIDKKMTVYADEIKSLAARLKVDVSLPGEISKTELKAAYENSDIFLCLSEHEGFGLPVIEAMKAGLPVVGYRSSAIAETLRDHPLACDELDYVEIAARLFCLTDVSIAQSVVRFQTESILPRFSASKVLDDFFLSLKINEREPEAKVSESGQVLDASKLCSTISAELDSIRSRISDQLRNTYREPMEPPERYVTIADISAYEALLSNSFETSSLEDLRSERMETPFHSPMPIVGRIVDKFKRFVLYSQDGVVISMLKSDLELHARLDHLETGIVEANRALATRLEQLNSTLADFLKTAAKGNIGADRSPGEVFSAIYENHVWGGASGDYYSGSGSDETLARPYAEAVKRFMLERGIKRVVDLGCGDFRVGSLIAASRVDYLGIDVVPKLIARNKAKYRSANVSFDCLDIISDELPDADLCLIRQVFQHLSNWQIQAIIKKLDKYPIVLVTEHYPAPETTNVIPNRDKVAGADTRILQNSAVFLELPPFNLNRTGTLLDLELPQWLVHPGERLTTFIFTFPQSCANANEPNRAKEPQAAVGR